MTGVTREQLARLHEPFPEQDIEWRIQRADEKDGKPWAMVLAYVTSRGIMQRLDTVCGPENWRDDYRQVQGGFICDLSIRVGDEWITKSDGADPSNFEAFKGGISGALKRAAVKWGIGRYLYQLDEGFAQCEKSKRNGWNRHFDKAKSLSFWWCPPPLPDWALPEKPTAWRAPWMTPEELKASRPEPKQAPKKQRGTEPIGEYGDRLKKLLHKAGAKDEATASRMVKLWSNETFQTLGEILADEDACRFLLEERSERASGESEYQTESVSGTGPYGEE